MGEKKETNPKQEFGAKKVSMHVVPCSVLLQLALGMTEGACKYGAHNYRKMGVRASTYYDAAMRHLMAWWEGEDIDPDSGLSHITKAMTSLTVLLDSVYMRNWVDDRPMRLALGLEIKEANQATQDIACRYPDSIPPYTHKERVVE